MDTITITFPEVKVKIPIKGLTFDILENMLFEILQNIARKVFEKAITDIDNYLRKNRKRGKLKNTGKRKKYFLTRFGDILYSRTRYKDKKTTLEINLLLVTLLIQNSYSNSGSLIFVRTLRAKKGNHRNVCLV